MKITVDYRNPTPSHCDAAIFINGALAGVLKLRQEELDVFQHIILHGLDSKRDEFLGTGNPGPWPISLARHGELPRVTDEHIDKHLDAVLRASGSALKHYSLQKPIDDMRAAMRAALDELKAGG